MHRLRAHVLKLVFEFDFLGDRSAITRTASPTREAANDVAVLISLLPTERRAMLGIAELADVAMLKGSCRRGKGSTGNLRSPHEGFAPLPKAVSRR